MKTRTTTPHCYLHPHQHGHIRDRVRETVNGIGHQHLAAAQQSCQEFERDQGDVHRQAQPRDLAHGHRFRGNAGTRLYSFNGC